MKSQILHYKLWYTLSTNFIGCISFVNNFTAQIVAEYEWLILKSVRVELGLFSLNIHLISIITQLKLTVVTHIPRVDNKNLP